MRIHKIIVTHQRRWDSVWGIYFCVGAYIHNVVAVIKMGAYIHGCLFCVGAYYPDFTVD